MEVAGDEEVNKLLTLKNPVNESIMIEEVGAIVCSTVLDVEQEIVLDSSEIARPQVSLLVDVLGKGLVYKMNLVSSLNVQAPCKLPLDHLKRVKYKRVSDPSLSLVKIDFELDLFDDVAVKMKNKSGNISWFLCHV